MSSNEAQQLARRVLVEMGDDWATNGDNGAPSLRKTHSPESTFHQACRFHDTYRLLTENLGKDSELDFHRLQMHVPRMMLLAFTCELYLKSIIHLQSGKPTAGHYLDRLFREIQEPFRETFIGALVNAEGVIKVDFWKDMSILSNAFVKARYLNEEVPSGEFNFNLLVWINTLSEAYLASQRPDWKLRYERMASPEES